MKKTQEIINLIISHIPDLLVVLLGVLIALFINNINENRKRKKRISQILAIVKDNMQQDIDRIDKELKIIDSKADLIGKVLGTKICYEELSFQEKMALSSFLFAHPQQKFITKEGYRLLRDADFDYNIKKEKIISDIIDMYENNIMDIERELNRVVRITEKNCDNYIQDDWLYYNKEEYWRDEKIHPTIETFVKKSLQSSIFINELDYLAKNVFGTFRGSLEKYRDDLEKLIKLL